MKDKKREYYDCVTSFWKKYKDSYDRTLASYVEDKVMECRNELASSWDDFKKRFLSDMDQVTSIVELEEEDVVKACYAGYRRGKEELMRREKDELSLTEFKEQYLPKVVYLAEILGLDRDRITNETREFL